MAARLELYLVEGSDGAPIAEASVRARTGDSTVSVTSDERGRALIELADPSRHLGVHVARAGFVPKLIAWDHETVGGAVPEQFTLKMERGHTIGGIVRNQQGEPVKGATVLVTLRGSSPDGVQPRIHNDIFESPATTDAEGRWQFAEAPGDLSPLRVRLSHPDYVSNEHIPSPPPVEDFGKGTAVLTLLRGIPCEGTVTDEHGRPLQGVKVILGEDGADSTSKPNRRTDENGKFRFGGVTFESLGEKMALSFNKGGFAPELVELQPSSTLIELNVVMKPGKPLRVRVTDTEGNPVAGALLAMNHWRKHRPFQRHFESDEAGLAVWDDAPSDAVGFCVLCRGYQRLELEFTASDQVQTVVLRRSMFISGRVIDARTKRPIPNFSLIRGSHFAERQGGWSRWNHAWVYPFTNGEYRCSAGDPVVSRNRDGSEVEQGFRRIRVSAPGYAPAISRLIANDEVDEVTCDFELEPAENIAGIVRDAEGVPVAGAEMIIVTDKNTVMVMNGRAHGRGSLTISTDDAGRYEIPPQEGDFPVVVAHPKAGYLVTSCAGLRAGGDIRLRAWGRLELRTSAGGDAKSHYYLREASRRGEGREAVRFMSDGVVIGDGLVAFEGLAAGPMRLYMEGATLTDGDVVIIEEGQTTRVDRRTGRRTIIGQIMLPPTGLSTDEPMTYFRLRRLEPGDRAGDWWPRRGASELPFKIDFAGNFRIADVVTGRYQLIALFLRSLPRADVKTEVAAFVVKEFELAEGNAPFDLGELTLQTEP